MKKEKSLLTISVSSIKTSARSISFFIYAAIDIFLESILGSASLRIIAVFNFLVMDVLCKRKIIFKCKKVGSSNSNLTQKH